MKMNAYVLQYLNKSTHYNYVVHDYDDLPAQCPLDSCYVNSDKINIELSINKLDSTWWKVRKVKRPAATGNQLAWLELPVLYTDL